MFAVRRFPLAIQYIYYPYMYILKTADRVFNISVEMFIYRNSIVVENVVRVCCWVYSRCHMLLRSPRCTHSIFTHHYSKNSPRSNFQVWFCSCQFEANFESYGKSLAQEDSTRSLGHTNFLERSHL